MKTNVHLRRGFTLVELLVVITIIAALAALVSPQVLRALKKADLTTATSNSRQIGLAMFNFQNDYQRFPDSTTQTDVEADFDESTISPDTSSSNGYFRQLFVGEFTDSEEIFYAKTSFAKKPDGVFNGDKCLEARECGFGYILNGDKGLTTGGSSARVIAATPFKADGTFDTDPFAKKAVVLRIDQSAQVLNINTSGEALLGGGKKLFDAGANTIWEDIMPTPSLPLSGE